MTRKTGTSEVLSELLSEVLSKVIKGAACFIFMPLILMLQLTLTAHASNDAVGLAVRPDSPQGSSRALLDVGISVTSGISNRSGTDMEAAFRETEAVLIGQRLRDEFENAAIWGVIRLYPQPSVIPQINVHLTVLESDGRLLEIMASASAVTGESLLTKVYSDAATDEDYVSGDGGPFAELYAAIVNDVASALSSKLVHATYLRTVSSLRYAHELIPDAFPGYLVEESGLFVVRREPSRDDPMLARLRRLQEYELLFVDTIDEQLGNVASKLSGPYDLWLRASKEQLDWLDIRRERSADAEALRSESTFTRLQAVYAAHRSLKIHEQELFELVLELESEARATVLYANEHIFRLSGTLEQQYGEWRAMLRQINDLESVL